MKNFIGALMLLASVVASYGHGKEWLTDFGAAKKQAAAENKKILMLFTGSDWCPYCKQWAKEVFTKTEFLDYAKEKLVLVFVDFPEKKKLPKAQERANNALQDKYNVEEFPMVYLLDAKGKEITRFKYLEGGWTPFREKIEASAAGK